MRLTILLSIVTITLIGCMNRPTPQLKSPCVAVDSEQSTGNPCIRRPVNLDKFLI